VDREKLSALGNPLEQLCRVVDFETFRRLLEERLVNQSKRNNAGARPFDVVLMFKVLILQRYYSLGDRQMSFKSWISAASSCFYSYRVSTKYLMRKPCGIFGKN
jgi:hypothetical protein